MRKIGLMLAIASLLFIGCNRSSSKPQANCGHNDSFPAPDFVAKDFTSGKTFRLSDFRGKPVVVNFWFAACPPCRQEAPAFKKFSQSSLDIIVLSVTDLEDGPDAVQQFIKEYEWKFPALLDSNKKIAKSFSVEAYPTTLLISREGVVVGKIVNYLDWETAEMKDVLEHLRNGKLVWYYRYLRRKK